MPRQADRGAGVAVATVAAAAALIPAPSVADAAVSCERTGAVLDVTLSSSGDGAVVEPDVGTIHVADLADNPVPCAGATSTVNNTDAISVHDPPGPDLANNEVRIFNANQLAPGATPEPGTDDIETFVNLGPVGSMLRVRPDTGGGTFVFGADGININATAAEDVPDADVTFTGSIPSLSGFGLSGPDVMSAQGGSGTGSPLSQGIQLSGDSGSDTLSGGGGNDTVGGGTGPDDLEGRGGNDFVDGWVGENVGLSGGAGNDQLLPGAPGDPVNGGDGMDVVDYAFNLTAGASFDDPGGGRGVETVLGTPFDDVLRGGPGPEVLQGRGGNDTLEGRGGNDTLEGNTDNDSLDVRDGGPDTADCGDGADTATADAAGIDALTGCESVLFPPPVGDGPGDGDRGGSTSNEFAFGKPKRNKRKGTAKLTVDVADGPGQLDVAKTKKIKADVEPVEGEGATEEKLVIKPKGQAEKKLKAKGKARVTAEVTYTPDGGEPLTKSKKLKLKMRR
ncbi:MAG: calcium-binding protein [Actinomycetota bacterium]